MTGCDTARPLLPDGSANYELLTTPGSSRSDVSRESEEWWGPALTTKAPTVEVRKANDRGLASNVARNSGSQTARRQALLSEWSVLSGVEVEVLEKAFDAISPKVSRPPTPGQAEDEMDDADDQELGNELLDNLIRAASQMPMEDQSSPSNSDHSDASDTDIYVDKLSPHVVESQPSEDRKPVWVKAPVVKKAAPKDKSSGGEVGGEGSIVQHRHVSPRDTEGIKMLHTELCQMQVWPHF